MSDRITAGQATSDREELEIALTRELTAAMDLYLDLVKRRVVVELRRQEVLLADGEEWASEEEELYPLTSSEFTGIWTDIVRTVLRENAPKILARLGPRLQQLFSIFRVVDALAEAAGSSAIDIFHTLTFDLFDREVGDFTAEVVGLLLDSARTNLAMAASNPAKLTAAQIFQRIDQVLSTGKIPADWPQLTQLTNFPASLPAQTESPFSWRIQRIARTAATETYNAAMIEQLRTAGYPLKLWVTRHDELVRDAHAHLDGVAVPLDEDFIMSDTGELLRYPGDPNGSPGAVYNCRCVLVGEFGAPTYGIDWDAPVKSISQQIEDGDLSVSDAVGRGLITTEQANEWLSLVASGGPQQARAPKGTSIGGQWIDTPTAVLRGLSRLSVGKDYGAPMGELDEMRAERRRLAAEVLKREGRPSLEETAARVSAIYAMTDAEHRAAGATWYDEARAVAEGIVEESGGRITMEQAAAVIAHTSIRTFWDVNVVAAQAVARGGDFEQIQAEVKASGIPQAYVMERNIIMAQKALASDDPIGRDNLGTFSEAANKTRTFASNILGDTDGVTIDTWMYRVLGQSDEVSGRVEGTTVSARKDQVYEALAEAVRIAAEEHGVTPAEMQAVTWGWALESYKPSRAGRPGRFVDENTGVEIPVFIGDDLPAVVASALPVSHIDDGEILDYYLVQARNLLGLDVTQETAHALLAAGGPEQARAEKGTPIGGQWIVTPGGLLNQITGELRSPRAFLPKRASAEDALSANRRVTLTAAYEILDDPRRLEQIGTSTKAALKAAARQPVRITMGEGDISGLLETGHFMTMHEMGERYGERLYMEDRLGYEREVMGIVDDDPAHAPIYGWAARDSFYATVQYGNVDVVLKDEVKARTTYVDGDSLDQRARPVFADEIDSLSGLELLAASSWARGDLPRAPYVEAQIHGGVTLADIDHISIPYGQELPLETLEALQAKGIRVARHEVTFSGVTETFARKTRYDGYLTQARAPKGTSTGGQWVDTPGGVLRNLVGPDDPFARALGGARDIPITYKEALEGGGYQEGVSLVDEINPTGSKTNCMRVAAALELYARGYDANADDGEMVGDAVSKLGSLFLSPQGYYNNLSGQWMKPDEVKKMMQAEGPGARFIMTGYSDLLGSGHAWNAEVQPDGSIEYFDAQLGPETVDSHLDRFREFQVLRVDNAVLSTDLLNGIETFKSGQPPGTREKPFVRSDEWVYARLGLPDDMGEIVTMEGVEVLDRELINASGEPEVIWFPEIAKRVDRGDRWLLLFVDPIIDDHAYFEDKVTHEIFRELVLPGESDVAVIAAGGPDQARAQKGTPIGGQWILTPGGILERLRPENMDQPPLVEYSPDRIAQEFMPYRNFEPGWMNPELVRIMEDPEVAGDLAHFLRMKLSEGAATGVTISMSSTALEGVIREGRVLNAYETAKNEMLFYMQGRNDYEIKIMGADPGEEETGLVDPSTRPIYGHALWDDDMAGTYHYGEIDVKLKTSVLERTSWTLGDSLDSRAVPLLTHEIAEASDENIIYSASEMLDEYVESADGLGAEWDSHEVGITSGIPYVEAQVWGGVTLDDIESVTLTGVSYGSELRIAQKLAANGIKVFVGNEDVTDEVAAVPDDSL